ncbi:MAG: CRISPR-associated endonuclease Cas1, partial [Cellvibrionaceae bacterium]|nr:CRISPR-associated endonuclease Cas1 [Cellvibrionaceae bacterium]
MLDHLDSLLTGLDYKLVRYADDAMLLCKKHTQAERAQQQITPGLTQHTWQGKQADIPIRNVANGVEYLGYRFTQHTVEEANTHKLAPSPTRVPQTNQRLFLQQTEKHTLCIAGEPAQVKLHQQRLAVERNSDPLTEIPLAHLECVVLFGAHQITTQALTKAMQHQVPVYFANRFGHYQGTAAAIEHNPTQHLKQAEHFSRHENRLSFAKALVAARIRSQKEVLRHRKQRCATLNHALQSLANAHSTEQCLGIEGHATAAYWQAFAKLLPEPWEMPKREKRPPQDPINSLLSFGYALLYAHTDSLLRSKGLFPTLGGYHQSRGTH